MSSKVTKMEQNKTLSDIDKDLVEQVKGFLSYRDAYPLPDHIDRDDVYIITRIRLLADEWLRWRLM